MPPSLDLLNDPPAILLQEKRSHVASRALPRSRRMPALSNIQTSRGACRRTRARWRNGAFAIKTAPGAAHTLLAHRGQHSAGVATYASTTSATLSRYSVATKDVHRRLKVAFRAKKIVVGMRRSTIPLSPASGKGAIECSREWIIWSVSEPEFCHVLILADNACRRITSDEFTDAKRRDSHRQCGRSATLLNA